MTLRSTTLVLGAALLVGLSGGALAQSSTGHDASHSLAAGKSGSSTDASFMREAAADSLAEIQLGHIALDKSSSGQVKELAQRIIDDHTKANDQLMTIAERKQVTLPTAPMPKQKKEADKLQAMSGTAFDQAYARTMVKDHRKAVKLFGMESQKASDPDVKQFASATLPVLKTHLQMSEQLAGNGSMRSSHGTSGSNSMNHADGTPMDSNGAGMPASGSSTH